MAEIDPQWEVSVQDVKGMMDRGEPMVLIDVREPREHQFCRIEGAKLIPLGEMPRRLQEIAALAEGRRVVCHCHHGGRSLKAAQVLATAGVEGARSMAGGIDAWSQQIDAAVARY